MTVKKSIFLVFVLCFALYAENASGAALWSEVQDSVDEIALKRRKGQ